MRFLSLFSGIEAASCAWVPLGWEPVAFAEIDPFACAFLATRYPSVPNLGNVETVTADALAGLGRIDLVIGGFPCQDVSVAGMRAGFEHDDGQRTRSGLFHEAIRIVRLVGARWTVIENVPGLLSSRSGRDFATVVGALAGCEFDVPDGGWRNAGVAAGPDGLVEWATLDAQWFGLAQRRKRLFLVRHSGDWSASPPVLLEPACLRGDPPPSREAGEVAAGTLAARATAGGGLGTDFDLGGGLQVAKCLTSPRANGGGSYRSDAETETLVAVEPLGFNWQSGGDCRIGGSVGRTDALQRSQTPAVVFPLQEVGKRESKDQNGVGIGVAGVTDPMYTLQAGAQHGVAVTAPCLRSNAYNNSDPSMEAQMVVPFDTTQMTSALNRSQPKPGDPCHPLAAGAHPPAVAFSCKDHGADAGDLSPTLRAMEHDGSHANGGGQVAVCDTIQFGGISHDHATEAGPVEALRALRVEVGEEAFSRWGLGVLACFLPAEVLRATVHGGSVRCAPESRRGLVNVALSRAKNGATWSVRDLWEAGCAGCPSPEWRPREQLAVELGAYLSQLPQSPSPATRFMHALWEADQGSRLLREALSAVEEARRPTGVQAEPALTATVRRLVPEECEALQGFPRSYTLITYRGKPAADGPRYRALGNSIAVPCLSWIGRRLEIVDAALPG